MRAVLMFHGVDDSGSTLSVSPPQLTGIVRAIGRSGHAIVPLSDLLADPAGENRVALTFDDGLASVANGAAPLLRAEGVGATLFLTTGYVGGSNDWPTQPRSARSLPMMTWNDVEWLHGEGWEIEAHTRTHPDLRKLEDADVEREVEGPKCEIERRLGRAPEAFAYPYGYFDERVVDAVRRHYRYAVTVRMAPFAIDGVDPYRIPRLDAFYLRHPAVHERFGSAGFRAFLGTRAFLRRLRRHPGQGW
jgi:peptidoglycan/xylan/chitin deacetylase (PgdA/CDA1 family)